MAKFLITQNNETVSITSTLLEAVEVIGSTTERGDLDGFGELHFANGFTITEINQASV